MKRIIAILFSLTMLVFIASCKKERQAGEAGLEVQQSSRASNSVPEKGGRKLTYKASQEEIGARQEAFKQKLRSGRFNTASRPGVCPSIQTSESFVVATYGSECTGPTVVVTYRFIILRQASLNTLAYDFSVETILDTYIGSGTFINEEEACWTQDTYANEENGCQWLVYYDVDVTMDASDYESTSGTTNTVNGTCSVSGYPVTTGVDYPSLGFPNSYYTGNPARVTVAPVGANRIFIGTECSILCYSNHVTCPTSGSLTYWKTAFPGTTYTINFTSSGGLFNITGTTSGQDDYTYQTTLTYSGIGTSQVLNGTFSL